MRRTVAALLALWILAAPAAGLAATPAGPFADVPANSPGAAAIADLVARGVLTGNGADRFRPDAPATRADLATMLARALGWPLDGVGPSFADVAPADWFYTAVEAAVAQGVMTAAAGGAFRPLAPATRAGGALAMVRALGLARVAADESTLPLPFSDAGRAPAGTHGALAVAWHLGLLHGGGGRLRPGAVLTRRGAAILLERMLLTPEAAVRAEGDRVAAYVHVVPATADLAPRGRITLHAYAHDPAGYIIPASFTWSAAGGSVTSGGAFTAGRPGSDRVTATVAGGGPGAAAAIRVQAPAALAWLPASTVVAAGVQVRFGVRVLDAAGRPDAGDSGRTVTLRDGDASWRAVDRGGVARFAVALPAGGQRLQVAAAGLAPPPALDVTATTRRFRLVLTAAATAAPSGTAEALTVSVLGSGGPAAGRFVMHLQTSGAAAVSGAPATVSGGAAAAGTLHLLGPGAGEVAGRVAGGAVLPATLDVRATALGALTASGPAASRAGDAVALRFQGPLPDGARLHVQVTDPAGHHPPGFAATFAAGVARVQAQPTLEGVWTYRGSAPGYTAATVRVRVAPGPAAEVAVHPLPTSILMPGRRASLWVALADAYGNPVPVPVHATVAVTAGGGRLLSGRQGPIIALARPRGGGSGPVDSASGSIAPTRGTGRPALRAADGIPALMAPVDAAPPPAAAAASLEADLPGPGVAAIYVPAGPGAATVRVRVPGLPAATVRLRAVASAAAIVAGKGMWLTFPDWRTHSDADILARAAADGVTHLYLEVATTRDGFFGGRGLDDLLWKAHDAGIAVVAWVYAALWDPGPDVAAARAVAAYRSPLGDRADGIAADIEENMAPGTVAAYAAATRAALGGRLLVGVTYPPQQMPHYPYAALAPYVDAWAPMDYWHEVERAYTFHATYAWVASSVRRIRTLSGAPGLPFDVILQTFDAFAGAQRGIWSPTPAEVAGAVAGARAASAAGISFYHWSSTTPGEWRAIAAAP